jgi:hypothetical protein
VKPTTTDIEAPARRRQRAPRAAAPSAIDTLATRYHASIRREVRRLLGASPRIAEMASVCPAVVHVLAGRLAAPALRRKARRQIEEGATLKAVAATLGLPLWLRRLPPEAFCDAIPELPDGETFARRIAARLPDRPEKSGRWLTSVAFAASAADEAFAAWTAEQSAFHDSEASPRRFAILAAFAWFSRQPLTRAHELIVVPWRSEIAFDTALCAAKSWFNRICLVLQLPPGALTDTWLEPSEAMGYQFVPLLDHDSLIDEARAMHNCADQYSERLSREKCRLFSIRRGDSRVATLEVGPHPREVGVLGIWQLKTRHNMPAPVEVWQAAYHWLAQQRDLKRLPPLVSAERGFDAETWRALMAPYRAARGGAPWMPEVASRATFQPLETELSELALAGGVRSWLFT